jgi:hypothetical protein
MRVLLLGARAPSSAVLGYFGGLPAPSCTIKSLPTLEPLTYPGVAATPLQCAFYLLGARAPSGAVLGYFGGLPGPSRAIKSLPTLEPLTYPGVNFLLYKRPAAQPTHWRVIEALFSMVNVLEKRRGRVCADSNIIKIIFHHVGKNACDIYIYINMITNFSFHMVTSTITPSPA